MRFGGGHDYYDTVLAHGRDDMLFFDRRPIQTALVLNHADTGFQRSAPAGFNFKGDHRWSGVQELIRDRKRYCYVPRVIWFAGHRYAGVELTISSTMSLTLHTEKHFFWTKEGFSAHLVEMQAELRDREGYREETVSSKTLNRFFDTEATKAEVDWMVEKKVAIAVSEKNGHSASNWRINCDGLGGFGFAKCLDPYTAFQNLSQWVGGVLSGEGRPMVKITDEKVQLVKHGFDNRSFKHRVG